MSDDGSQIMEDSSQECTTLVWKEGRFASSPVGLFVKTADPLSSTHHRKLQIASAPKEPKGLLTMISSILRKAARPVSASFTRTGKNSKMDVLVLPPRERPLLVS